MLDNIDNIISWSNDTPSESMSKTPMVEEHIFMYPNIMEGTTGLSGRENNSQLESAMFFTLSAQRERVIKMLKRIENSFGDRLSIKYLSEEKDGKNDIFDVCIEIGDNTAHINVYVEDNVNFEDNEVYLVCKNDIQIGIIETLPLMLKSYLYV